LPIILRPNPSLGLPIYLQLVEQVKHAVETGAMRPGEQLPAIRAVAESLVINPNTVAKAYRELEHEGIVELRQGTGAFIATNGRAHRTAPATLRAAQRMVTDTIERLRSNGLSDEEIRRLVEGELAGVHHQGGTRG
jgi:DNA-binding transcriptional regulator YhcF (GntR family)